MLTTSQNALRSNESKVKQEELRRELVSAALQSKSNFALGTCLQSPVAKKVLKVFISSGQFDLKNGKGKERDAIEAHVTVYENSLELFRVDESSGRLFDVCRQSLSRRILDAGVLAVNENAIIGCSHELSHEFPTVLLLLTEDMHVCIVGFSHLKYSSADYDRLIETVGLNVLPKDRRKGLFVTLHEFSLERRPELESFEPTSIRVDPHGRGVVLSSFRRFVFFPLTSRLDAWSQLLACPPVVLTVHDFLWGLDLLPPTESTKFIVRLLALYTRSGKLMVSVYDCNLFPLGSPKFALSFSWAFETNEWVPLYVTALPDIKNQFAIVTVRDIKTVQLSVEPSGTIKGANVLSVELPNAISIGNSGTGNHGQGAMTAYAFPCFSPYRNGILQTMFYTTESGLLFRMDLTKDDVRFTPLGQRGPALSLSVLSSSVSPEWYLLALHGEGCDGEILLVDCEQDHEHPTVSRCFRLKNWAPSTSSIMQRQQSTGKRSVVRDTLYICANTGKCGSVKRIEQGLGASVISTTAADEMDGTTGLFGFFYQNEMMLAMVINEETRFLVYEKSSFTMKDMSLHYSQKFQLKVDRHSMLVDKVGSCLCQVTQSEVLFVHPDGGSSNFKLDAGRTISSATVFQGHLLATMSPTNALVAFQYDKDSVSQTNLAVIPKDSEPTCVYANEQGRWCAVGSRKSDETGYVHLYQLSTGPKGELRASLASSLELSPQLDLDSYPHSLSFLGSLLGGYLLCGLRSGVLVYCSMGLSDLNLSAMTALKIGLQPVELLRPLECGRALAYCGQIWSLSHGRFGLDIEPVLIPDVLCASSFPALADIPGSSLIAVVDNHYLKLVSLEASSRYNLKSLNVHNTPRKVVFDPVSGKLVVACAYLKEDSSLGLLRPLKHTDLKIIDPSSGKVFAKETLKLDELVTAMCVWDIKSGKRYLCIGTNGHLDRTNPPRNEKTVHGRVLVFHLKSSATNELSSAAATNYGAMESGNEETLRKTQFRLRQLGEIHLAAPVTALCTYHHSYLLAGAGEQLCLLKIDASKRELVTGTFFYLRSNITSISALPGDPPPNSKLSPQTPSDSAHANKRNGSTSSFGSGSASGSGSMMNVSGTLKDGHTSKGQLSTNHRFQSIAVGTESDGVAIVKYDFEAKTLRLVGMEPFGRPISCASQFEWSCFQGDRMDDVERKQWEEAQVVLCADRVGALRLVQPVPANMTNDRGRFLNLRLLADAYLHEPVVSVVLGQMRALLAKPNLVASSAHWLASPWAKAMTGNCNRYSLLENRALQNEERADGGSVMLNAFYALGILGSLFKLFPLKDDLAFAQLQILEYCVLLLWHRTEAQMTNSGAEITSEFSFSDIRATWPPQADTFAPTKRDNVTEMKPPIPTAANRFASMYIPLYLQSNPIISISVLAQLVQPPLCFQIDTLVELWLSVYAKNVPDALHILYRSAVIQSPNHPVSANDKLRVAKYLLHAVDLFEQFG